MTDTTRVAAITGAAQGIGRRTAEVLAGEGYALALLDRQPVDGFPAALVHTGDVADESSVADFARAVDDRYGRVDVLVNNAGIACIAPAEDTPVDVWRTVLDVNLTGPFLLCQEFGRRMLSRRDGSIVNIASVAGLRGVADRAAYNASKHGLVGLTRTLAVEWGGRGVRVNAVCPGFTDTDLLAGSIENIVKKTGRSHEQAVAELCRHNPQGRLVKPAEVADTVLWLCGEDAAAITGQAIAVAGGEV